MGTKFPCANGEYLYFMLIFEECFFSLQKLFCRCFPSIFNMSFHCHQVPFFYVEKNNLINFLFLVSTLMVIFPFFFFSSSYMMLSLRACLGIVFFLFIQHGVTDIFQENVIHCLFKWCFSFIIFPFFFWNSVNIQVRTFY